jgi:NitT/TauT family transport system ATP-binding protein
MTRGNSEALQAAVAAGRGELAISLLKSFHPEEAAALFESIPFESQQALFRELPADYAAVLVGIMPYYHAYVLVHSRPVEEMTAIVGAMNPDERRFFLDALPEEAWQQITNELSGAFREEHPAEEPEPFISAAPGPPIIEARQIEKRFARAGGGDVQVIAPTDLTISEGMIVAMLGPSGSGKSTLLRMLTGLAQPSSGEVFWHGKPLQGAHPSVAIVFQSFALFPWLTVLENVEAALLARGMEHAERRARALRTLSSVGLKGFENAYPKELSGGMRQRVGFARALAVEPEILFMDEPFSALDVLTAETLRGELMELWLEKKMPTKSIFIVTHNIEEAVLLADRVIVLGRNPARIRADFKIPLTHPRDRAAAEFLVYVDYIYKLMTDPEREAGPLRFTPQGAKAAPPMLPHARPGGIAGFVELVVERGGKEDLYHVAEDLQMEVDDLLPIAEAARMLGFVKLERGDVLITPQGQAFYAADIGDRQKMFKTAVLQHIPLLQQMNNALTSKTDHAMPLEFFRDVLDERFSAEETRRQIETALDWGRYSGIFAYDSERDRLVSPAEEGPWKRERERRGPGDPAGAMGRISNLGSISIAGSAGDPGRAGAVLRAAGAHALLGDPGGSTARHRSSSLRFA